MIYSLETPDGIIPLKESANLLVALNLILNYNGIIFNFYIVFCNSKQNTK